VFSSYSDQHCPPKQEASRRSAGVRGTPALLPADIPDSFATTNRGEDCELMPPRSERSGVSKDSPVPLPTLELCCAGCGYGARRRTEPERCPMCGGNAWTLGGWQPFAELAPSAETEAQYAMLIEDADAPLLAEHVIADSGVPAVVAAV
jgi:hypothetical protein